MLSETPSTLKYDYKDSSPSQFIENASPSIVKTSNLTEYNNKKLNPFVDDEDNDVGFDDDALFIDEECLNLAEQGISLDINSEGEFIGEAKNDGKDPSLQKTDYHFSEQLFRSLKNTFALHNFRPNQS